MWGSNPCATAGAGGSNRAPGRGRRACASAPHLDVQGDTGRARWPAARVGLHPDHLPERVGDHGSPPTVRPAGPGSRSITLRRAAWRQTRAAPHGGACQPSTPWPHPCPRTAALARPPDPPQPVQLRHQRPSAVLQVLQVAVAVERPAVNAARPAAPVAGLRGARTGVVGPGPAGAAAALVDPRSGLDADLPGPARPPAAHQASPPMACCQAPTTSGSRRARPSRSRMARAHRTPRRWGPPDKVWGRQATRRRDGWPAPEPSRHSAVAHDRAAATARKASAAGAAARLLAVPSGIDGAHRRRVNAQPVSRRIPEVVARSRRPDPADTCRSSGAATSRSRCRCATGWWAVPPSRSPSGWPASVPACRRRCRPGGLGHLGQHRTWRSADGRRDCGGPTRAGRGELPAGLRCLLLPRLHGLAAALGDGQPAREQAKPDQRSPPRPARCVAALLASLPGHHVHLPPPPR